LDKNQYDGKTGETLVYKMSLQRGTRIFIAKMCASVDEKFKSK